jgi:hypothetical protein
MREKFLFSTKHPDRIWSPKTSYSEGTGVLFPEAKRPGRGFDLLLLSGVKVKNGWSCTFTPHACHYVVYGDNLTLTFIGYGKPKYRASRSHCTAQGGLTVNASDL